MPHPSTETAYRSAPPIGRLYRTRRRSRGADHSSPEGRIRRGAAHAGIVLLTLLGLVLCAHAPLAAQAWSSYDPGLLEFRGIGLESARVWPARVNPTTAYGIRADLGWIGPGVRIAPSTRFWSSHLRSGEVDRLAHQIVQVCERQIEVPCPERLDLGQVILSDLELNLDAQHLFLPDRPISPYLGINVGLHLLNGRGDFIDGTFVEDLLDSVAPGVGTILGFELKLAKTLQLGIDGRMMLATETGYVSLGATLVWTLPVPRTDPNALRTRHRSPASVPRGSP